jgi:hypothetical protein
MTQDSNMEAEDAAQNLSFDDEVGQLYMQLLDIDRYINDLATRRALRNKHSVFDTARSVVDPTKPSPFATPASDLNGSAEDKLNRLYTRLFCIQKSMRDLGTSTVPPGDLKPPRATTSAFGLGASNNTPWSTYKSGKPPRTKPFVLHPARSVVDPTKPSPFSTAIPQPDAGTTFGTKSHGLSSSDNHFGVSSRGNGCFGGGPPNVIAPEEHSWNEFGLEISSSSASESSNASTISDGKSDDSPAPSCYKPPTCEDASSKVFGAVFGARSTTAAGKARYTEHRSRQRPTFASSNLDDIFKDAFGVHSDSEDCTHAVKVDHRNISSSPEPFPPLQSCAETDTASTCSRHLKQARRVIKLLRKEARERNAEIKRLKEKNKQKNMISERKEQQSSKSDAQIELLTQAANDASKALEVKEKELQAEKAEHARIRKKLKMYVTHGKTASDDSTPDSLDRRHKTSGAEKKVQLSLTASKQDLSKPTATQPTRNKPEKLDSPPKANGRRAVIDLTQETEITPTIAEKPKHQESQAEKEMMKKRAWKENSIKKTTPIPQEAESLEQKRNRYLIDAEERRTRCEDLLNTRVEEFKQQQKQRDSLPDRNQMWKDAEAQIFDAQQYLRENYFHAKEEIFQDAIVQGSSDEVVHDKLEELREAFAVAKDELMELARGLEKEIMEKLENGQVK